MGWTDPATTTVGELKTAAYFNSNVRDNLNAVWGHLIARKPSDEPVTSSTVFQADDHLALPVLANEVWQSRWTLRYTSGTAGDIKVRFTFPSGAISLIRWGIDTIGASVVETREETVSPSGALAFGGSGSAFLAVIETLAVVGGTGGNVVLEWAQNVSDATATIMKAHSTLWGVKLA